MQVAKVVDVLPGILRQPVVIGVHGDLDAVMPRLPAHLHEVVAEGKPGRNPGGPEVMQPEFLREEVARELKECLERYSPPVRDQKRV